MPQDQPYYRAIVATLVVVVALLWLFEARMLDSRRIRLSLPFGDSSAQHLPTPAPGVRLPFTATAYCKGTITRSGVTVRSGIAAADPAVIPVGSVVQLDFTDDRYTGVYTVLDTGPAIEGREIDLYMWSCIEATAFGRRPVQMTVLRLGWNPQATAPRLLERLRRALPESQPVPAPPLPTGP